MVENRHHTVGSLCHVTGMKKVFPGVILSQSKLFQHFFSLGLSMGCTLGFFLFHPCFSICFSCLKGTLITKYNPNNSSSYTARFFFQCMVDLGLTDCPSIFIQNIFCSKDSYVEYKLPARLPLLKW